MELIRSHLRGLDLQQQYDIAMAGASRSSLLSWRWRSGSRTDAAVLGRVRDYLESLRMTCITMKKYIPGFIVNRLQRALGREIFHLIDEEVAESTSTGRPRRA